ncbi:MAG: DNA repair protein RecO [Pseudomonadota bacterium]|nr:DNA repair protein RecO [Pseudomonadota bacterium]
MKWSDDGIVLSTRKHGENAAIVTLLTRCHGRHSGLARGGASSRIRGIYQTGNIVCVDWRARLSEHLGTYTCELVTPIAAHLMTERLPLQALISAVALAELLLPEREPYPEVFESLGTLIGRFVSGIDWQSEYVRWEVNLLGELGYGLDLSQCAATGCTDNLIYVSPRTGRAVSASAGRPYSQKLFPLPAFLLDTNVDAARSDVLNGLKITGHFLSLCTHDADAGTIPIARRHFIDRLSRP